MQIPKVLTTSRLARKPQPPSISAQILVSFEREPGRPIGVAAVGPGRGAPAGIHEINRLRHVLGTEHLAQGREDLGFGEVVGLLVDDVGLVGDDGDEEDAAAGEEVFVVEVLPHGVVAAGVGGVEEELGAVVLEDSVGRELEENFGVDPHLEGFDGDAFPVGEGGGEGYGVGLENADGEGVDGVVGFDAGGVCVVDCYAGVGPGYVGDYG